MANGRIAARQLGAESGPSAFSRQDAEADIILGRFRRLHPQVAVRTKVRMSLVLRSSSSRH